MEILLTGYTAFLTQEWIETAFPDDHVLTTHTKSEALLDTRVKTVTLDGKQLLAQINETYQFDRIVYFSEYLLPHGEQEGELLRSAIEFHELDVSDILTPRVDVVAVSDKDTPEEVAELFRSTGFSRLPYYEDTIDNILGVINQKDFYGRKDWKAPVKEVVSSVLFITDSMKISRLLHLLQQNKAHMAVVTDEYGGTAGIVTLEDVIEELVGDIWDEHDAVEEEDFKKIAERRYRVEGSADLEEMLELFGMEEDPELDVSTVNGWVLGVLGRIPKEGEVFQYDKLTAKVTKADERRVIEVEVNAD